MSEKNNMTQTEQTIDNRYSLLTACSFNLFHAPYFSATYGTTIESERHQNPDSDFLKKVQNSLRSFAEVSAYPPNQVFIGNLDPRKLEARPWYTLSGPGEINGRYGDILDECFLYGLIKFSDVFNLVKLEKEFSLECKSVFRKNPVTSDSDFSCFDKGAERTEIEQDIAKGAVELAYKGSVVGCIQDAHPNDINLKAPVIFENLVSKATAFYAVKQMIHTAGIDPAAVDYIIETSEEACGDMNQRGGGNFAKAIGELAGLTEATGSDTRSFCAAPMHGLIQAASLVKAGTFERVIVAAGGTTAKLAMNAKKHLDKGLPILEDCMGSFALLVEKEKRNGEGLLLRTDAVGIHRIGSGSSPQAVVKDLVVGPVYRAGYQLVDIDYYAPELQNPEITEPAGAGNVTESNLKMIAAMAVMNKEIERDDIGEFIAAHGSSGWAPTQGHIPSGVPAFAWLMEWARQGTMQRALVIGKGSLFLGRMTSLFDGISLLVESSAEGASGAAVASSAAADKSSAAKKAAQDAAKKAPDPPGLAEGAENRVGLTLPGSEGGVEELKKGVGQAKKIDKQLEVVQFGEHDTDAAGAHKEMEAALKNRSISAAVTFHYPFPIGVATVGHCKAPGNGRDLFLATTTGTAASSRVEALIRNVIYGIAAAKAFGIAEPEVGFLNLDGAAWARKKVLQLIENGYTCNIAHSVRGDELLRGNDILAGSVDVVICDSLTGNIITKLMGSFSTAGKIEEAGSGYGPGIGEIEELVCIVSRASAAPVIRDALLFAKRMGQANLKQIYLNEMEQAQKAGLKELLKSLQTEGANKAPSQNQAVGGPPPPKKVTDSEIEGLDVLVIDEAVSCLMNEQIYCTAGMGCTGPVIMVAGGDKQAAQEILKKSGYL